MGIALDHRTIESWDGTRIAYQIGGTGPAVVLANGLGGDVAAWKFLIEALGDARTIVSWDYRGLYRSAAPPSWDTLGPAAQARDLVRILEKEGIERCALVGWSMGVQVSLEIYRLLRERVGALVAINGVAGRPFDTALAWRFSRHVVPLVLRQMRRKARDVGRVTRDMVAWRGLLPTMQRLDGGVFLEVARGFSQLDFDLYGATMEALGRHDAWDLLREVRVPTTIITGDRDLMTPMATARKMARGIAGAKLVVLEGATHYTPVEHPRAVGDEVLALLGRVGF
jgi:pimeloyl-ACP methyl ester carboxylesterase